jgi:hypothetical protein
VQLGSRFNLTDQPYWFAPRGRVQRKSEQSPKLDNSGACRLARGSSSLTGHWRGPISQRTSDRNSWGQVPDRRSSRSEAADSESCEQQRSRALELGSFWRKPMLSSVNLRLVEMPLNVTLQFLRSSPARGQRVTFVTVRRAFSLRRLRREASQLAPMRLSMRTHAQGTQQRGVTGQPVPKPQPAAYVRRSLPSPATTRSAILSAKAFHGQHPQPPVKIATRQTSHWAVENTAAI